MSGSGPTLSGPERLRVYHLALAFARQVDALLRRLRLRSSLADQLTRAAESIILNIAEGAAHFSPGKKRYHYRLAHGSASECIGALTRLRDRYPGLDVRTLRRTADMICVMLMPLMKDSPE